MLDTSQYKVVRSTRASQLGALLIAALIILGFVLPAFVERSVLQDLFFLLTMIALAQCWNLLAGYGGLVSVGQQAFVGIGAYVGFSLGILAGLNPIWSIILGGLAGLVLAFPTAFVVFRLQGAYFAIGTWVAAEVFRLLFAQWKAVGGGTGTSLPTNVARSIGGTGWVRELFDVRSAEARDILYYWMSLILVVAIIGLAYWLLRTRAGLALTAIRDNPDAAESIGVDTGRAKLGVYLFAAFGAALTGALIFFQKGSITPNSAFHIEWTAYIIFIVVIGGIGTLEGPVIGALILFAMRNWLSDYGTWYLMLLGAMAVVVMLLAPRGIWGWIQSRYDFSIFPTRRRLIGPDTPVPDYTQPARQMAPAPATGVRGDEIRLPEPEFDIETDVLIIGSGPAGLASAALLSTYGVANVMVEKYAWLANSPRAHITNQRTMEVLRELGLEQEAVSKAVPQELMGNNLFCTSLAGEEIGRLRTWGTSPERKADYTLASPTQICDLPQTLLEPIILNAACARGTIARFKTEYVSHTQDRSGVVATVRDRVSDATYRIKAQYMIGADGARSQIVQDLGLPMEGEMGLAGSMNLEFEADLSKYVAHRPSVLYWIFQPGLLGGIGAGVIRMIRPWYQWMGMYNYDVKDGPPDLSEDEAIAIIHKLIGDDTIPIKLLRVSYWTVNHMVARTYAKGRVFCMGDAVHRHPPSNGLGSNTSIQDAYNLCWKLKLVLEGKAGDKLLGTYDAERQPVGKQIVNRANKSIEDYVPIFETLGLLGPGSADDARRRFDARKDATAEAEARRKALNKYIRQKSYEFNCHGVELGQRYRSDAIISDGTAEPAYERDRELYYHATTWPGARLPHVWLQLQGKKISSLDLVGRGRFTVFTGIGGAPWIEAGARVQAETGVQVSVFQIGPGCEVADIFGDWSVQSEVSDAGCVLVRPDGHVALRRAELDANPADTLRDAMHQILAL